MSRIFGTIRQNGYVVDAEHRGGITTRVRVPATVPGTLRRRNPFPAVAAVQAHDGDVQRDAADDEPTEAGTTPRPPQGDA